MIVWSEQSACYLGYFEVINYFKCWWSVGVFYFIF